MKSTRRPSGSNPSERSDWGVTQGAVFGTPENLKTLEEERERVKTRSFKLGSALASAVLAVVGAILVSRADFEHAAERSMGVYNVSVRDWNVQYRPRFESMRWQIQTQHLTLDLTPSTQKDAVAEDAGLEGEGYIPLTFRLPDVRQLLPGVHLEDGLFQKLLEETQNVSLLATSATGQLSVIRLTSFALLNTRTLDTGSWKSCLYQEHGYWNNGLCISYTMVDSVCVKVSEDSSHPGLWQLDTSFGGEGCDPFNTWQPLHLLDLPSPSDGTVPLPTSAGPLIVRSRYDPRIVALNMTEGSLFFAGNEASEMIAGWVLLSLAAVIILPTLLLSVSPLLFSLHHMWQQHARTRSGYQHTDFGAANHST